MTISTPLDLLLCSRPREARCSRRLGRCSRPGAVSRSAGWCTAGGAASSSAASGSCRPRPATRLDGEVWQLGNTSRTNSGQMDMARPDGTMRTVMVPRIGEAFTDQVGVPILALVTDSSPGVHDMLFPPCDRWLYESAGLFDHPNCLQNFISAAASMGISLPVVPDPVNVFQNSRPQQDGTLSVLAAASEPGDAISFRALRDDA